jgi:spore germination protein YaaH
LDKKISESEADGNESARGMREKLALAAKHHLAGVALWRLGYEETEFWREK